MKRGTVLLLMCLCLEIAYAHQQKESYTTILFNSRSGKLEISHRFYLHDAEHALQKVGAEQADLAANTDSQQQFADYLLTHFVLKSDQIMPLDLVGFEIEGKYFWVYQEANLPQNVSSLSVAHSALQEVWPKQINHINVERNGLVSSVRLQQTDSFKEIRLVP